MKYSNCLIGAIVLMFIHRTWRLRVTHSDLGMFPHFYVEAFKDGKMRQYHYGAVKLFLPGPFCTLLFEGKFQEIPDADIFN